MANRIIKGKDLMLFDSSGASYAYATNHTFTLSAETLETSSKDHGLWNDTVVGKYTWEVTSENLYTESGYNSLFDSMILGEAVNIIFGIKAEDDTFGNVADGTFDNWTKGTNYYKGKAIVTSLTANANNGEHATISITFTGVGSVSKVGINPVHLYYRGGTYSNNMWTSTNGTLKISGSFQDGYWYPTYEDGTTPSDRIYGFNTSGSKTFTISSTSNYILKKVVLTVCSNDTDGTKIKGYVSGSTLKKEVTVPYTNTSVNPRMTYKYEFNNTLNTNLSTTGYVLEVNSNAYTDFSIELYYETQE